MMLEEALDTHLNGYAGLTALVSSRIYPMTLPGSPTYPAVTYQRVETKRVRTMGVPPFGAKAKLQVTVWATTHDDRLDVAQQVRAALEGYTGVLGGGGGVTVLAATQENEVDVFVVDMQVYQGILEFAFLHAGD